jgi:hypothetical protein
MYPITTTESVRFRPFFFFLSLSLPAIVVGFLLVGCKPKSDTTPSPLPTRTTFLSPVTSLPTTLISPVKPVSGELAVLPEGTQRIGAQYVGDFDGDGQEEVATGYKHANGGGGGITVGRIPETGYRPIWQEELSKDSTPSDFVVQDLDGDESPELLLFAEKENGIKQDLFVYTWTGSTYTPLKPTAGPLDGQSSFLSLYWPTVLDDVDSNGTTEIITFGENKSNPEALSAVVYEWNGSAFHYTELYIIPPRFKPSDHN